MCKCEMCSAWATSCLLFRSMRGGEPDKVYVCETCVPRMTNYLHALAEKYDLKGATVKHEPIAPEIVTEISKLAEPRG